MRFMPGRTSWFNIWKLINVYAILIELSGETHMIISTDAEKLFDKSQHSFMMKTHDKIGMDGDFFNI